MLRSGKVVAAENGVLEVCFERPEACAHCGQCGGQKTETFVKIPGSVPVGRWIDVDMPEGQVLKASMLAYVMPLLMLLGGLALGSVLFEKEIFWALTGVVCMGASWLILRLIEKRMKQKSADVRRNTRSLLLKAEGFIAQSRTGCRRNGRRTGSHEWI